MFAQKGLVGTVGVAGCSALWLYAHGDAFRGARGGAQEYSVGARPVTSIPANRLQLLLSFNIFAVRNRGALMHARLHHYTSSNPRRASNCMDAFSFQAGPGNQVIGLWPAASPSSYLQISPFHFAPVQSCLHKSLILPYIY